MLNSNDLNNLILNDDRRSVLKHDSWRVSQDSLNSPRGEGCGVLPLGSGIDNVTLDIVARLGEVKLG